MPNHPDDLNNKGDVSNVVGAYKRAEGYTFSADNGVYGGEGRETWLAVPYDSVKESASSATMMASKWMSGTEWMVSWDGLDEPAEAKLDIPLRGDWAFLRLTKGG
jgi:hypothetical protein